MSVRVTVTPDNVRYHNDATGWIVDDRGFLKLYKMAGGRTTEVAQYNPRFWVGVAYSS